MFIESVPNRIAPPAVLLRESYRDETGRTQKRTLANLSKLPDVVVAALRAILKGGTLIGTGPDELQIERSLPYGHVAAGAGDDLQDRLGPTDSEHGEGCQGAALLRSRGGC